MTVREFDPLFGEEREEIPLPAAPLVNVLCQVRFPEIVSIEQKAFISGFQEQIRSEYPAMSGDHMKTVSIDEGGSSVSMGEEKIWRFVSADRVWRLSLAPTFLALETRKYVSRNDFLARLETALAAAAETLKPTHVTRIGTRYIDRVELREDSGIGGMLRPEMLGVVGGSVRNEVAHAISEALFNVKEGQMLARWGVMPPSGTHDPNSMPPVSFRSWFLDVDTFTDYQSGMAAFDSDALASSARDLATRSYAFFRWAVTDKFLKEFGGEPK